MPRGRIQINVVQRDIDRAVRVDSSRCVVATAVARAVPDATRIEVDTQTIRFTSEGKRLAYLTPLTVQGYVAAFDAGDPISPFSFQLRDPMELRRRLLREESKPLAAAAAAAKREAYREKEKARHKASRAKKAATGVNDTPASFPVSYSGIHMATVTEGRKAPPRVFKTKARTYGHRQLRINRPVEETADA
jgi:hypothetical protein